MKKVTLVNGGTYIGYDLLFHRGDVAMVEDAVADSLLRVTDTRGRFRFKEGKVVFEKADIGRGDLSAKDFPKTVAACRGRLDELGVRYPANATKAQLLEMIHQAAVTPGVVKEDAGNVAPVDQFRNETTVEDVDAGEDISL